ncbi:SGNH/GDSL hydrolase family protein [Ferrovibrio terrae]|uniref:SGNH/GDSL hydrolase family protein n=1 Tax=Ferrovibrio terrae TaxID=2594003 RepID=A0A516H247_9PROT|nr:SGNH/GDSL hydrolase family protein [Ferrovibrio terrae]QDO97846.1 SGNH/GDSL hydrolase family protein [Ferrovibrio terrae]
MTRVFAATSLLLALLATLPQAAGAMMAERCAAPMGLLDLGQPLPRVAARLARNETVSVVAIGSSSTGGAGASAPEFSYPSQLATLWPQLVGGQVEVHNRGINGQDILQMNERLQADAVEIRPDLVLWQLGTNDVLRSQGVEVYRAHIQRGIALLQAAGIDVVLIDLQYAPKVLQDRDHIAMQKILADLAVEQRVALFRRFAIMRYWLRGGLQMGDMVTPDGLHMNDLGYACWAHSLARAIQLSTVLPGQKSAVSGKN